MASTHTEAAQSVYGCVFCLTGQEKAVARALAQQDPAVAATALSRVRHQSAGGRKTTVESVIMPGYVFFRTAEAAPFADISGVPNALRLLKNPEGSWPLHGADARFAAFVFENDGVIGLSKARKIGDKVTICEGPLKALEGHILKIDRHNRNGQVEIRFGENTWKVWLAFEIIE